MTKIWPQSPLEVGCFVYQVVHQRGVSVKHQPDDPADKPYYHLQMGELVAVDMIISAPGGHGKILRLADQSGWVQADLPSGELHMRETQVVSGLWSFFVDNYPLGQAIRRHPMDATDLLITEKETQILQPMQKIYCDKKVTNPQTGVNFYRLQTNHGWVFDRRATTKEDQGDLFLLLEDNQVKTGLFAYKSLLGSMSIRKRTDVSEASMTRSTISQGEIVTVDVVRESPYQRGNGPFLRLTDGSGWLFESKFHKKVMEEVPIQSGSWELRVWNPPMGMALRRHPMDCPERLYDVVYGPGELIECDAKIYDADKGVNYFRVRGTKGWVFDFRDGSRMLEVLSSCRYNSVTLLPTASTIDERAWTPDFVRGIAATVDGLEEVASHAGGQVLSFKTANGVDVNVYYRTRVVGTMYVDPMDLKTSQRCVRNCTPQELLRLLRRDILEIMKGPRGDERDDDDVLPGDSNDEHINTGGDEEKKDHGREEDNVDHDEFERTDLKQQEEILLRKKLQTYDEELSALQARRQSLCRALQAIDDERSRVAKFERDQTILRMQELEQAQAQRQINERKLRLQENQERLQRRQQQQSPITTASSSDKKSGGGGGGGGGNPAIASVSGSAGSAGGSGTVETRQGYVCGECFRVFPGRYSRDLHCREAHSLFCPKCDKIFPSFASLDEHRAAEKHW